MHTNLSSNLREFLQKEFSQQLIRENNLSGLYYQLGDSNLDQIIELTRYLIKDCKVDPMEYFGNATPINFMNSSDCDTPFMTIPENINFIQYKSFANCKKVHTLSIDEAEDQLIIDVEAFVNCTSLQRIEIEKRRYIKIRRDAFKNCYKDLKIVYNGTTKDFTDKVFVEQGAFSNEVTVYCDDGYVRL